ncbi:MAG: hypothetical protein GY913_24380 [Proteobacteria bacterium]|nr:hypothetical protein [Pseudomonadota bacterium]MCP4920052.1 hypothetical protein [Pseudomonadota bacterium]
MGKGRTSRPRSTSTGGSGDSGSCGQDYVPLGAGQKMGQGAAADAQKGIGNTAVKGMIAQEGQGVTQGAQSTTVAVDEQGMPPSFDPVAKAEALHSAMDGWGTDEREILDVLYTGRADMVKAIEREYNKRYDPSLSRAIQSELSGDTATKALRLLAKGDLSLAEKILEGASGWGTDEDKIFNALERADAADLAEAKANKKVMGVLQSELGGEDLALAMAYLNGKGQLAAQLRRAVDGWGTDEETIFRVLQDASAEERNFVLSQPKLMNHLKSDLDASSWQRASRMLRGQLDNVDRLEIAMAGWGTDEVGLHAALAALTADEYARLSPDFSSRVESELSGRDQELALEAIHQKRLQYDAEYKATYMAAQGDKLKEDGATALMAQEGEGTSAVAKLIAATKGMGTDDKTIWDVIAKLRASEREFIAKHNPDGVLDALRSDLSDSDYSRVMDSLGAGGSSAVALLRKSVDGWGTDEGLMYLGLERVVAEQTGLEVLADTGIMDALRKDLSSKRYSIAVGVLNTNYFGPVARLRWATTGAGTDEDLVFSLCKQYAGDFGSGGQVHADIEAILEEELSTRDYWAAMDSIRGEPTTEAERLERSKELLERERGGISTTLMDSFSHSGENADDAWREYQASYNQSVEDGEISQEELQGLRQDEEFSKRMTAEYASAKASVAQWATQIAVAIVGIAATILTAGAAGPFVAGLAASLGGNVAVMAEAMVLAAALKVGLNKAIQGEGYDLTSAQTLIDAASGAVEIGMNFVGGAMAQKLVAGVGKMGWASQIGPTVEKVFGGAGKRILSAGFSSGVDGGIGGMGEGLFLGLVDSKTWGGDIEDAFGNIGTHTMMNTAMSAGSGFVVGAGVQSIAEVFGPMLRGKVPDEEGVDGGRHEYPEGDDLDAPAPEPKQKAFQDDDTLPKIKEDHASSTSYKDVEGGTPFVKGASDDVDISPHDVKQGSLGDCYFMAGMAATARANAEDIRHLIKDNGDGTFDVTLWLRKNGYGDFEAVTRTVDGRFPMSGSSPKYAKVGSSADGQKELWPMLLEKRLAMEPGDYTLISGGNVGKNVPGFDGASPMLRGKAERYTRTTSLNEDQVLQRMQAALDSDQPITVDSHAMADDQGLASEAKKWNVYGNHAYAVESVDIEKGLINLQNPWGSSHVKELPVKDFKRFYKALRIGDK